MAFSKRAFHLLSLLPSTMKSRNSRHVSHVSQAVNSNLKRVFIVDTLALVRGLEAKGVPSKQAEAITSAMTHILNDSLENVSQSFVSKSEMQKSELLNESNLSKFKIEMQSSQERHFSMIQRESEKLRSRIEKMGSELRNENDKNTAELRLELQKLRAQSEAFKYDVISYFVGSLVVYVSIGGLAMIQILS